jgi:DNA (cytosine-5)-methyltransferase 1
MGQPLVLSLFPGIGLLDRAFEEQGFCVVRGPDLLWGGDVKEFHPPAGRFEGVIGGPPCQCHSKLADVVKARGHELKEDLIPEFARCVVEAKPDWYLMENVPAAPMPETPGYASFGNLINNRAFGGVQDRKRVFVFGVIGEEAINLVRFLEGVCLFEAGENVPTVTAKGVFGPRDRERLKVKNGPSWATVHDSLEAQGLPADFLDEIPFTARGAQRVIGNGVPLPMGRAIAKAVWEAMYANGEFDAGRRYRRGRDPMLDTLAAVVDELAEEWARGDSFWSP